MHTFIIVKPPRLFRSRLIQCFVYLNTTSCPKITSLNFVTSKIAQFDKKKRFQEYRVIWGYIKATFLWQHNDILFCFHADSKLCLWISLVASANHIQQMCQREECSQNIVAVWLASICSTSSETNPSNYFAPNNYMFSNLCNIYIYRLICICTNILMHRHQVLSVYLWLMYVRLIYR